MRFSCWLCKGRDGSGLSMKTTFPRSSLARTGLTLAVALVGAALARALNMPVFMLTGPAVAVSLCGLGGMPLEIDPRVRNLCFMVLGMTVGSGFDPDALGAMVRWPLAFAGIFLVTWGTMVGARAILSRGFGFTPYAALLAGSPGHLSFVIAMAEGSGQDVVRISVVQSVRLLLLTLVVPFVAVALGVDMGAALAPAGAGWPLWTIALMGGAAWIAAQGLVRLRVPAPLLIGAMLVAGIFQLSGVQSGVMPDWMVMPAYLALGALIGTRFAGVQLAEFLRDLGAGLAVTGIAGAASAIAAFVIAVALGMPPSHVLVAFAPGGLETMIAMGVVLGIAPGFVAACHITRLLVLSVLLPLMARRSIS